MIGKSINLFRTSVKTCWMTTARASTFLFPCISSFLQWLLVWFFFSTCSLLWLGLVCTISSVGAAGAPAGTDFEACCGRGPVLGLDREAVLVLSPRAEGVPDPVVVVSAAGTGGTGVLAFTTSGVTSGGGWCWLWLFPPAAPCELLLVFAGLAGTSRGLFLSTVLLTRLSLVEPLLCRGFWDVCFVRA